MSLNNDKINKIENTDNWKMNRAGFVNFWYYDNEVFDFQDGRLLLRGSNGSGKSVTMQSLIPLLLDGNKSPDRLDPFGSKARKIDNYLLDDNKYKDERTGYIYLEFIKKESNSYLTIGLGIKARKNMPVTSWGFCIVDGRRIGKDIELTKTTVGDIPYSKKELQNRIGNGGYVYDSMAEYKKQVNSLLFGYGNIDDYSDLIKLLIQLRSPKLSKDFKPTVLYEIMTNALQTLSDDELRPMSEAIESMDTIKYKLEALEQADKSCQKINDVYDKYNKIKLYDKSIKYVEAEKKLEKKNNEIKATETKKINSENEIINGESIIEKANIDKKIYSQERESLGQSDAFKLEEQLTELNKNFNEFNKKMSTKSIQLEKKEDKLKETENKIKKINDEQEQSKRKINDIIDELTGLSNDIGFSEFDFVKDDFLSRINEKYDLSNLSKRFSEYKDKIKNATELLKKKNEAFELYNQKEKQYDDCDREKSKSERTVKECEQLFTDTKDEYITEVNRYSINNSILKIPNDILLKLNEKIYSYAPEMYFDDINTIFINCYNQYNSDINVELSLKKQDIENKENEIVEINKEIDKWTNMKEPEPERKEEVINNRKKLDELNIPYVPFYKLLDFNENIKEDYKGVIEEALLEMGVLDALIIPEKYKQQVLSLDNNNQNMCDKYVFTNPQYMAYELSNVLHIDKNADKVLVGTNSEFANELKGSIDEAIRSILMDNTDNSTFISENGTYGIGIIKGRTTGNYKARYIGTTARNQLREDKIKEFTDKRNILINERNELEKQLDDINNKIILLNSEKNSFPKNDNLETAKNTLKDELKALTDNIAKFENASVELKNASTILEKAKEESYYACEKIYIEPKDYKRYCEALDLCTDFDKIFSDLSAEHRVYVKDYELLIGQQSEQEYLYEEIDNIRAEKRDLQHDINETQEKINSINEVLKLTDYESIKARIQVCINMLENVIPKSIEDANIKIGSNKNEVENCKKQLDKLMVEKENEEQRLSDAENEFITEYNYKLIEELDYDDDNDKIALKIVKELDYIKTQLFNITDITQKLNNIYFTERNSMSDYMLNLENKDGRMIISSRQSGKNITFRELMHDIKINIEIQKQLIEDKDRQIFEEILFNNLNKIIRAKIVLSKAWVKDMNDLMESLDTSSGLSFSLKWKGKKGESEDEISTEELVELLDKDQRLLRESDKEKFAAHFRAKIERARSLSAEQNESKSFHAIIKELLDYRQWFEFQLYFSKTNENKKELTNNAFYQFSGGEKAMAMYVPLFSAVSARYSAAEKDSPRIISLDEAFAGVDSKNIRDMFKLLRELKLDYIINSQVLWGDYDTVPSLAISEILRPNNSDTISVINYKWNGKSREMVV